VDPTGGWPTCHAPKGRGVVGPRGVRHTSGDPTGGWPTCHAPKIAETVSSLDEKDDEESEEQKAKERISYPCPPSNESNS
jgi:hypothetical protein